MEVLIAKRSRLHDELQCAYEAWIKESERSATGDLSASPVDVTGAPDGGAARWQAYLAAKQRLVLAYAEQALAA